MLATASLRVADSVGLSRRKNNFRLTRPCGIQIRLTRVLVRVDSAGVSMSENRQRVVVVGAGFGGLEAARNLAKLPVQITLIDRKNHHTFQPLLYQVATAGISPGEIAAPIRWILRDHHVEVLLGEVEDFDLQQRTVKMPDMQVSYDYLIVATGATH